MGTLDLPGGAHLQGVAGVVLAALVLEGLAQVYLSLVVHLVPVASVAGVHAGADVAEALLVSDHHLQQEKTLKQQQQQLPAP